MLAACGGVTRNQVIAVDSLYSAQANTMAAASPFISPSNRAGLATYDNAAYRAVKALDADAAANVTTPTLQAAYDAALAAVAGYSTQLKALTATTQPATKP